MLIDIAVFQLGVELEICDFPDANMSDEVPILMYFFRINVPQQRVQ